MQAVGPLNRDPVPFGRRDQAEGHVEVARAVPLPVIVHLPTQLPVQPRILARHVVRLLRRARLQASPSFLDRRHDAEAVAGVGAGAEEGVAAGGGEGVAQWGEDHEEEEGDEEEEEGGDEVQEAPLARVDEGGDEGEGWGGGGGGGGGAFGVTHWFGREMEVVVVKIGGAFGLLGSELVRVGLVECV